MLELVKAKVGSQLDDLGVFIDDVFVEKEGGNTFLRIVLDSENIIDLITVEEASRRLNPILDELDLIEGSYILDIYSKEKGEN